jgi:hypothetical protein
MPSYSDDKGHDFRLVVMACYLVGDTGIEPVTSSVSGKDDAEVTAKGNSLASGFIRQHPPAHPTRATARGAHMAHGGESSVDARKLPAGTRRVKWAQRAMSAETGAANDQCGCSGAYHGPLATAV